MISRIRFNGLLLMLVSFCGCRSVPETTQAKVTSAEGESFKLETIGTDERIIVDAKINGRVVHVALDTGTGAPVAVFSPVAAHLGLKLGESAPNPEDPGPGRSNVEVAVADTVELFGAKLTDAELFVLRIPPAVPFDDRCDGVLGWPAISENILAFYLGGPNPVVRPMDALPLSAPGIIKFVVGDGNTLSLKFANEHVGLPRIIVDTGSDKGVMLSPAQWRIWNLAHPRAAKTMETHHMPGHAYAAWEIAWADEIEIGDLVIHDVPVSEADPAYARKAAAGEEFVAFGLAALKRVDLVVDGKTKLAVAWPRSSPSEPYRHNRIGAAFVPRELESLELVALVVAGGPAADADVRDGDVLLKVNERPADEWWKDPITSWEALPGTKFNLTLRRGAVVLERTVVARDILMPRR